MPNAIITFHKVIQNTQEIDPNAPKSEHMLSKIFFTLDYKGQIYRDMTAVIRQPFGTNYEQEPVEVERPKGSYKGNWNHNDFRDLVERYYRAQIGSSGSGIKVAPGIKVSMVGNVCARDEQHILNIPEE